MLAKGVLGSLWLLLLFLFQYTQISQGWTQQKAIIWSDYGLVYWGQVYISRLCWVHVHFWQFITSQIDIMASQINSTGVLFVCLFFQLFIHAHIKENINAPRHRSLWGESIPSQRASYTEKYSNWWRRQEALEPGGVGVWPVESWLIRVMQYPEIKIKVKYCFRCIYFRFYQWNIWGRLFSIDKY